MCSMGHICSRPQFQKLKVPEKSSFSNTLKCLVNSIVLFRLCTHSMIFISNYTSVQRYSNSFSRLCCNVTNLNAMQAAANPDRVCSEKSWLFIEKTVPGVRHTVLSRIFVMEQSTHSSCSYIMQLGQSSVQIFNCCWGDASNLKRL